MRNGKYEVFGNTVEVMYGAAFDVDAGEAIPMDLVEEMGTYMGPLDGEEEQEEITGNIEAFGSEYALNQEKKRKFKHELQSLTIAAMNLREAWSELEVKDATKPLAQYPFLKTMDEVVKDLAKWNKSIKW